MHRPLKVLVKGTIRVLHVVHKAKKVEGMVVAIATAGAVTGLKHAEVKLPFDVPFDKIAMWADVIAGLLCLCAFLLHKLERKHGHGHEAHAAE